MKKYLVVLLAVLMVAALAVGPLAAGKTGPAGKSNVAFANLCQKDSNWDPVSGGWGKLKYNQKGSTFDFVFNGHGLDPDTSYTLIYYADPWPGNNPGAWIASGTSNSGGNLHLAGSIDLGINLPDPTDANYSATPWDPTAGAKIWLVPSSDYNSGSDTTGPMTGWNPNDYLYERDMPDRVYYNDTDVP